MAVAPNKTVQNSLEALHRLRVRKVRASQEVLDHVEFLQEKGVNLKTKMGDEFWPFLEQLTAAALDLGRDDIAEECLGQLNERFPDSPRVQILFGMRREASGDLTGALKLYDAILEVDEAHAGIWKRRVAVYRQLGDTKRAAEDLCRYLDTFYTDVEGWLELADLYASRYELSAQSFLLPPLPLSPCSF
ncbi:hypothetical protein FRC00_003150 [Tulasnella sp. 408]|nr:hypothetical protein FRC00_003150 [Tulasnella sp. 408]